MRTYNQLPRGYSSWKNYLLQDVICIIRDPEQHAKYAKMYSEHMEALYHDMPPWSEHALLVKYRLPDHVVREKSHYGIYGFWIYDKQTGRKRRVSFNKFEEYGLDKIKGTCQYTTAWPYIPNKAELQRIIDKSSEEFWDEANEIRAKLEEYEPQTYRNTESRKERHRYYLGSKQWHDIAERVRSRDGWSCKMCLKFGRHLDVHHNTYARWGEESLNDLKTLCRECHEYIHRKSHTQEKMYA